MTTYECFQKAERIENIAREIYTHLASEFQANPGVHKDFQRLADEEAQHAQRIRLLGSTQRSAKGVFDGITGLEEDLEAGLRDAEGLLAEVKSGGWGQDLAAVTPRIVAMEERFAAFHAQKMARGAEPSVQKLFAALALQDREHAALLERVRKSRKEAAAP